MGQTLIKNIGCIVSGDIKQPILSGDALLVSEGRIAGVGRLSDLDAQGADLVIDAAGMAACPGLIDAHTHPLLVDYIQAYKAVDWFDSYLHGGVTGMISAGEVRQPGRPRDGAGAKALAILARKVYQNHRPSGVKVDAGAVLLEPGLQGDDFAELARAGCTRVGEVGMGSLQDVEEAAAMLAAARQNGLRVLVHAGGASGPGCASYTVEDVLALQPDVVCHLNGAPTPVDETGIARIFQQSACFVDLIEGGNVRVAIRVVEEATRLGALDRLLLGTNAPSASGFAPTGLWGIMAYLCAFTGLKPELAIAMASGNVARCYGLETGIIAAGRPADLLLVDAAIGSSGEDALGALAVGDIIGLALAMVDGEVLVWQSRNTTPPRRSYQVTQS